MSKKNKIYKSTLQDLCSLIVATVLICESAFLPIHAYAQIASEHTTNNNIGGFTQATAGSNANDSSDNTIPSGTGQLAEAMTHASSEEQAEYAQDAKALDQLEKGESPEERYSTINQDPFHYLQQRRDVYNENGEIIRTDRLSTSHLDPVLGVTQRFIKYDSEKKELHLIGMLGASDDKGTDGLKLVSHVFENFDLSDVRYDEELVYLFFKNGRIACLDYQDLIFRNIVDVTPLFIIVNPKQQRKDLNRKFKGGILTRGTIPFKESELSSESIIFPAENANASIDFVRNQDGEIEYHASSLWFENEHGKITVIDARYINQMMEAIATLVAAEAFIKNGYIAKQAHQIADQINSHVDRIEDFQTSYPKTTQLSALSPEVLKIFSRMNSESLQSLIGIAKSAKNRNARATDTFSTSKWQLTYNQIYSPANSSPDASIDTAASADVEKQKLASEIISAQQRAEEVTAWEEKIRADQKRLEQTWLTKVREKEEAKNPNTSNTSKKSKFSFVRAALKQLSGSFLKSLDTLDLPLKGIAISSAVLAVPIVYPLIHEQFAWDSIKILHYLYHLCPEVAQQMSGPIRSAAIKSFLATSYIGIGAIFGSAVVGYGMQIAAARLKGSTPATQHWRCPSSLIS